MSDRPVHIIVNANAAQGKAARKAGALIAAVRDAFPDAAVTETRSPDDAQALILSLSHRPCTIVAAGGDGTLHHLCALLVGTDHRLGIIPAGTGNDFAAALGLTEPGDILRSITGAVTRTVDTGTVTWEGDSGPHTRPFINSVGIGFDAAVAGRMRHSRFGSGIVPYLVNVMRELRHLRLYRCDVALGDESLTREVFLVAVGNGISSGGGFNLTPRAQLDDGLLDVCLVSGVTRWRVLRVLPEALTGNHLRHPEVEYFQTAAVHLMNPVGLPLHADGEYLGSAAKSVRVKICPASLKILCDNRIIEAKKLFIRQ